MIWHSNKLCLARKKHHQSTRAARRLQKQRGNSWPYTSHKKTQQMQLNLQHRAQAIKLVSDNQVIAVVDDIKYLGLMWDLQLWISTPE